MQQNQAINKDDIIQALRKRYDYWSARAVLNQVLDESGMTEQETFGPNQIRDLCAEIRSIGDRVDRVIQEIGRLADKIDQPPKPTPTAPAQNSRAAAKKTSSPTGSKGAGGKKTKESGSKVTKGKTKPSKGGKKGKK